MFGKVVKYEMRTNALLYGIMAGISILIAISVCVGAVPLHMTHYLINQTGASMMAVIIFCAMVLVLVPVLHMIIIGMRYAKSMYGREGYLSFTLPVSSTELVLGKFTASVLWGIVVSILCGLLLFAITYSMMVSSSMEFGSASAVEALAMYGREIKRLLSSPGMLKFGISLCVSIILRMILFTNYVFLAITLANLPCFQKGNTILTFVFLYFIPYLEERILSGLFMGFLLINGEKTQAMLDKFNFAFEIGDFPTLWNGFSYSIWGANIFYIVLTMLHLALVIWMVRKHTALAS